MFIRLGGTNTTKLFRFYGTGLFWHVSFGSGFTSGPETNAPVRVRQLSQCLALLSCWRGSVAVVLRCHSKLGQVRIHIRRAGLNRF